ncbi:MAG: BlaI/MecI/CopY family transcriptional regulator [Luteolibacter sp.]|uniref:BlaI/MecI/CopY family transcriptional regulator n=1 Tax=Luteolibacter sp. TaxID=1962973 RepID=UPI003265B401
MPEVPRISESEWKVMEVVWAGPPVTAQHVTNELGEAQSWKPQTVKTLLARLVAKSVLRTEADGIRFLYHPEVSRETAVAAETDSFLDRIRRGSLVPMLAHLMESKRPLSEEEIEALRGLLPEKGGKS